MSIGMILLLRIRGLIAVMGRQVCEHRNHGTYKHNIGNTFRE